MGGFYNLAHFQYTTLYFIYKDKGGKGGKKYKANDIAFMYVVPYQLFECKAAELHTQVISMLVISILLRSLEQINTCSTFAESLMPNCLLSRRAETAVKCSSTGPSLIIFPFKCQDKEQQTAVLIRKRSRLQADKISFFILCLLLHSLCHGA